MIDLEKLTREIHEITDEHTVIEAIAALNSSGKKAMSWQNLDKYVMENGGYYWSGLLFVRAAEGTTLGEKVEFDHVVFEVPAKWQGTDDQHALIISHEHLLVEGNTIFLKQGHESDVQVLETPRKDGYYMPNDWGFPNGKAVEYTKKEARFFWQRRDAYVGLLARDGDGGRFVVAGRRPSLRLGVLLE